MNKKIKVAVCVGIGVLAAIGTTAVFVTKKVSKDLKKEQEFIKGVYKDLGDMQSIAWRCDDWLEQDDLFELQDKIADTVLVVAKKLHCDDELPSRWPWLYEPD